MKKVLCTYPNGETKKFSSKRAIAKEFKVTNQTAYNWMKGTSKPPSTSSAYGCTFTVVDDDSFDESVDFQYEQDKNGHILPTANNIIGYLQIHFDSFTYNELTDSLEVNGTPITDKFIDNLCVEMDKSIGINNDKKVRQCITSLCLQDTYHPLKEKIEENIWDGTPRAEEFFIKFLGAHDTPLNRFYTRCWFKAAIKRLYEPGCMWDHMLILYDRTGGTGKTKIFERLSLGFWASDVDVSNKDSISVMNHAWIVNFDELARFDKKGMNTLKTFITTRSEVNRLAYERYAKDYKRHCIFCGTTNEDFFLRDYTSERERRFWIVNCSGERKDDEWWKKNLPDSYIDQVWAEVKYWYDEDPNIDTSMSLALQDDERLIQAAHKSFGNDPEFEVQLKQALDGQYSQLAMNNFNTFKKEVFATDYDSSRVIPINRIEVKQVAALFKKAENYTAAVILHLGGWIIRDGFAIRSTQYEMSI